MHFNNRACGIKHLNATELEATVVRELGTLSRNEAYVKMTVEEANRNRDERVEPLQEEEARLQKRLAEIEAEIQRFVTALGQGKVSVGRLEKEIREREAAQQTLEAELASIRQRIAEEAAGGVNADLLLKGLQDFEGHLLRPESPGTGRRPAVCAAGRHGHAGQASGRGFRTRRVRPGWFAKSYRLAPRG